MITINQNKSWYHILYFKHNISKLQEKLNDLFRFMNNIDVIFTSAFSVTENQA